MISQGAALRCVTAVGIDPGIASVGYGVVRSSSGKLELVIHGCIETKATDAMGSRLTLIHHTIRSILEQYAPDVGGIEELYFFRNVSSAFPVAEARGVIRLAFEEKGVRLFEYSPNAIKKAVTGTARADKFQVQEMVRVLLGMPEVPKPDHAADALAAAICTLHSISSAGYTF
ncbi:MAG: crossover junction endodeoxyribonuclease RuvC [Rectinema sp.]|nr:crossover junction endodeoxyribonuclease RuvC [Rectinema sp.]